MKSILGRVGSLPQVEGEPRGDAASELVTKQTQTPRLFPRNAVPGLDLEADHLTVFTLAHEVDLVAITSAPVAESHNLWVPRRVLEQLADRERLHEVAEFPESGRVASCELCRGVAWETAVAGSQRNGPVYQ